MNLRRFNPRTHTGCDVTERHNQPILDVSIHAPTRGATPKDAGGQVFFDVSIHAPTRGATPSTGNVVAYDGVSIHAPTRGATGHR